MSHTFRYRALATSWGVFVSLTAEAVPLGDDHGGAEVVAEGLFLSIPDGGPTQAGQQFPRLLDEERECLRLGLRLVSDLVRSHAAPRLPIVVRVQRLEFSECDFQPEGLVCAVAGWAAEEFGFPPVLIPVAFDRGRNRYQFQFPPSVGSLP